MYSFSGLEKNMRCHAKPHKIYRKVFWENLLIRKIAGFNSKEASNMYKKGILPTYLQLA